MGPPTGSTALLLFRFAPQTRICGRNMETKKFIDILEIYNGKNQKSVENPDGKYPIYGSGGVMGRADEYICPAETVVIGRKGSINNPIFVTEPFWNVDTAFGLVARKEVLLPKYLFYFCRYFDFEKLNTTVTIPSLTKANLLKIEIPIPSIIEQKSIVTKLNLLTDMIQQRQEQLTKLDELIKARFVELSRVYHTLPTNTTTQKNSHAHIGRCCAREFLLRLLRRFVTY